MIFKKKANDGINTELSIFDDVGLLHPKIITTPEMVDDRQVAITREVAKAMDMSIERVHNILHEYL